MEYNVKENGYEPIGRDDITDRRYETPLLEETFERPFVKSSEGLFSILASCMCD